MLESAPTQIAQLTCAATNLNELFSTLDEKFPDLKPHLRDDSGQFVARCMYGFPIKEITGASRVVLSVRDPEGKDVTRFTIDLSTMR